MPNEKEIATIEINGTRYRDWETVAVEAAYPNVHRTAIFTVSEREPAGHLAASQIKPQDECTIRLGDDTVLTGYVVQRQGFLDANNHAVLIEAYSKPSDGVRTSHVPGTVQWKGKTIVEIAREVYKPLGVNVITRGREDGLKFKIPDVQLMLGESAFHLVERLARDLMVWIGDDEKGQLVLDGGADSSTGGPRLAEGENIKWIRATIQDKELMSGNFVFAQSTANDKTWGRETTELKAESKEPRMKRYKPYVVLNERALDRRRPRGS
jgi:prophage tail gpP-like protein